jgi:hypothetical protein
LLVAGGPLLASRFPNGVAPGWPNWLQDLLLVVMVGSLVLLATFAPVIIEFDWLESLVNPFRVPSLEIITPAVVSLFVFAASGSAYGLAIAGLLHRYRGGTAIERAQIRWFAASIGVVLAMMVAVILTGEDTSGLNDVAYIVWISAIVLLPPIAIGIAILRYRLYDIDRIISNTVAYSLVTTLLFAVFALVNLGLQGALRGPGEENPIAVALATLIVAALFHPVRVRVQHAVDLRFHRARYDAQATVEEFSTRLRNELDLGTLAHELTGTTSIAVQPATIDVWLRARTAER